MGSSKSVYTWTTVDFPAGGTGTQAAEIPNLPTKGKIIRVRFVTAVAGTDVRYWIADTSLSTALPPVPTGGTLSMVTAFSASDPDPIDHLGAELRDSNGAVVGENMGIPFELTETGPPGSKVGSLFLAWNLDADVAATFQLVTEPLVT